MLCLNFVKFGRRVIGEIVRCSPEKKSPGSPAVATVWDGAQNLPGPAPTMYPECSRFNPNRFTFGGAIAERVNTEHREVK